jgi:polyhydroxybutyrate depolymerase
MVYSFTWRTGNLASGSDERVRTMNQFPRLSGLAAVFAIAGWVFPALSDTIAVNGVTRTFTAQLPAKRPAPLVIVLHGNTQTGADMASRTSWPAMAQREQFGVVFPDGLNRAWADLRPNANRAGRTPP